MIRIVEETYVTQLGSYGVDTNFGQSDTLQLGMPEGTYSYDTSSIYLKIEGYDKRKIKRAVLKLYSYAGRPDGSVALHRADAPWSKDSITWRNQPGLIFHETITPVNKNTTGLWWEFELTDIMSFLQQNPSIDNGLSISWSSSNSYKRSGYKFYSSRHTTEQYRPMIEVEYEAAHIVESAGKFYSFTDQTWEEVVFDIMNDATFKEKGMPGLKEVPMHKWEELQKPVSIHSWTEEEREASYITHAKKGIKKKFIGKETPGFIPKDYFNEDEFSVIALTEEVSETSLLLTVPEYVPLYRFEEISILTWMDEESSVNIIETSDSKNSVRYLISRDKIKWHGFDGENWVEDHEMTQSQLHGLNTEKFSNFFGASVHKENMFIKARIYSEDLVTAATVMEMAVAFVNNEPPLIIDPSITPDSIQANFAEVKATIKDQEGDSIEYRVLIKKGSAAFQEVKQWQRIPDNTTIEEKYDYTFFALGANQVKIEAKDQRGLVSEWTGNLTLTNEAPFLAYSNTNYWIRGTIGDNDTSDKVTYRIYINDVMMFDYLDYAYAPRAFSYDFNTKAIRIGEINTVKIEIKDLIGSTYVKSFQIIGTYKGIMFIDENNYYYSDQHQNLLQWLDFGVIKGGEVSEPKKVILENRCGFAVQDIELATQQTMSSLFPEEGETPWALPKVITELSETKEPFVPTSVLKLTETLADEGRRDIYLRVVADREVRDAGEFRTTVKAKAIT